MRVGRLILFSLFLFVFVPPFGSFCMLSVYLRLLLGVSSFSLIYPAFLPIKKKNLVLPLISCDFLSLMSHLV